jgi:hypothetical protein
VKFRSAAIRFAFATSIFLLVNGVAHAQMGSAPREAQPYIPDVDRESLILQIPEKWYPYHLETENKVDTFVFPTGQKPEKWREMLRYERFLTTQGVTRAKQVFDLKTEINATNCVEYEAVLLIDVPENGYSMSQWTEHCVLANDSSIVMLNKVIVGFEQLFVVAKVWKYDPKQNDMDEWLAYMRQVYVCDPNMAGSPCRPPNRRAGGRRGG